MNPLALIVIFAAIIGGGLAAASTTPHIVLTQPVVVEDHTDGINYQHNLGGSGGALTDTVPNCTRIVDRNTNQTTWSACI